MPAKTIRLMNVLAAKGKLLHERPWWETPGLLALL